MNNENLYFLEEQTIRLKNFHSEGRILDMCGGGEGIIGILKGDQVIVIDNNQKELEEAPEGPIKIIMDATDLKFLDESFSTVTAFFGMMFIPMKNHFKSLFGN